MALAEADAKHQSECALAYGSVSCMNMSRASSSSCVPNVIFASQSLLRPKRLSVIAIGVGGWLWVMVGGVGVCTTSMAFRNVGS